MNNNNKIKCWEGVTKKKKLKIATNIRSGKSYQNTQKKRSRERLNTLFVLLLKKRLNGERGKKSEVDSANALWDAGTDTPRVIEPRSVALGFGLQGSCKQVYSHYPTLTGKGGQHDLEIQEKHVKKIKVVCSLP